MTKGNVFIWCMNLMFISVIISVLAVIGSVMFPVYGKQLEITSWAFTGLAFLFGILSPSGH